MAQNAYIFNQLHSLLPRDYFEYLVKKHQGNTYIKTYSCWNYFLVMLWAQLTKHDSLRDIESSLRAHRDKLYRLGMGKDIYRNNISHANSTWKIGIFRDFAQKVMNLTLSRCDTHDQELSCLFEGFRLSGLFAVDSSTVYLDLTRSRWSIPHVLSWNRLTPSAAIHVMKMEKENQLTRALNDAERCSIVCEVLSGKLSRACAVKKYHIGEVTLYRWIRKFAFPSLLEMEMQQKQDMKEKQEVPEKKETPLAELVRLREELHVTKAFLYEEIVRLAGEKYGIDLLKNYGPKQ